MTALAGRRDPDLILAMLADVIPGAALDRLSVVRVGTHVVVRSLDPDLILRVDCPAADVEAVERWNLLLKRMAAAGAPVVPPLESGVLRLGRECTATRWPLGEPSDAGVRLGALIRRLHDSGAAIEGLPRWTTETARAKILERLMRARQSVPFEVDMALSQRVDDVFGSSPNLDGLVLTHGDAHSGNVVTLAGRPALVDLDDLALAPRELDLAPSMVTGTRFKDDAWTSRVLDDYGRDRIDPANLQWFTRLREVTMNSWLATLWHERPEARAELLHRIATWEGGGKWHPM